MPSRASDSPSWIGNSPRYKQRYDDNLIGTLDMLWEEFDKSAKSMLRMSGIEAMQAYDRDEIGMDRPTPDATSVILMMPSIRPQVYTMERYWRILGFPEGDDPPHYEGVTSIELVRWKAYYRGRVVGVIKMDSTLQDGDPGSWGYEPMIDGRPQNYTHAWTTPQDAFNALKSHYESRIQ